MWHNNYKKVNGVVTKKGLKYSPHYEIDFNKLAEITNHYDKFIEIIKENYEEGKDGGFRNIVVYRDERVHSYGHQKGENVVNIYVAFDHHDTYIRLFGCNIDHEKFPYIHEFSQNKIFVSMMSKLL